MSKPYPDNDPAWADVRQPESVAGDPHPTHDEVDPTCVRHPDVVTYVRCQRCQQPTCTRCQRPASVGVHCVGCVEAESKNAPVIRSGLGFPAAPGRPMVSYAIIAICVLVWLGQKASMEFYGKVAFIPLAAKDEPWRFLTAGFAHDTSSIFHLLFNMYALYVTGQYLEPLLGRIRFAALFLLSVLGGSVAYLLLTSPPTQGADLYASGWATPLVGASGGVFGLFLAVIVLNRHMGRDISGLLMVIGINAVLGFVLPNISWQAHLGGALVGALVAGALYALRRKSAAVQYGMLVAVGVALFAAAYVRYSMVDLSWLQVIH